MRKPLLALSLAFALVVPVACGGSGDDDGVEAADESDLQALMLSVATQAAEKPTYRFEGKVAVPVAGESFDMVLTGVADNDKPLLSMDMDLGAVPGFPGGGDATMSIILAGKVFYMRFPAAMAEEMGFELGGKSWAKLDLATLGPEGKAFEALLAQARQADPASYVALLTGATDDITEVGTEKVRGTETRHFKMTVDPEAVAANASPELKEAGQGFLEKFSGAPMPVEVWIGDDNLPRRITYTIDTSTLEGTPEALEGAGTVSASIELFDYGTDVDVDIPPAEDTFDFADLLGGAQKES